MALATDERRGLGCTRARRYGVAAALALASLVSACPERVYVSRTTLSLTGSGQRMAPWPCMGSTDCWSRTRHNQAAFELAMRHEGESGLDTMLRLGYLRGWLAPETSAWVGGETHRPYDVVSLTAGIGHDAMVFGWDAAVGVTAALGRRALPAGALAVRFGHLDYAWLEGRLGLGAGVVARPLVSLGVAGKVGPVQARFWAGIVPSGVVLGDRYAPADGGGFGLGGAVAWRTPWGIDVGVEGGGLQQQWFAGTVAVHLQHFLCR